MKKRSKLIVSLLAVVVLTLLRSPICDLLHRLGQRFMRIVRRADPPQEDAIPPLRDDLP